MRGCLLSLIWLFALVASVIASAVVFDPDIVDFCRYTADISGKTQDECLADHGLYPSQTLATVTGYIALAILVSPVFLVLWDLWRFGTGRTKNDASNA